MFNRKTFDIVVGITFLLFLAGYLKNQNSERKKKNLNPRYAITKANDILRKKITLPPDQLNTTATSSACTFFLKNSAESTMNDYANEFVDHHIDSVLKNCTGAFPSALQIKIDEALLKCKNSTHQKVEPDCYAALMQAKTKSVAIIIKPSTDPKTLDPTILLHLIADKFSSGEFFDNPKKSLDLIDALLDQEPNYLSGYKVKLLLLGMSSLAKEQGYQEMYKDTFLDANRLKMNDPELLEISLAVKGELFTQPDADNQENVEEKKERQNEYIQYLEKEARTHKDQWLYDYYLANAIYENGNGDLKKAMALIENRLLKDPTNSRLKQTLANFNSTDDVLRHHPFILSIGFNLNDL